MILRGFRATYRAAMVLSTGVALYIMASILGGLLPGDVADLSPVGEDEQTVEIGLLFGPIHTDFVLPATPGTRAALSVTKSADVPVDNPQVRHFLVGWGARDFYTTVAKFSDITPAATWQALAGDNAVLRVDAIGLFPSGFGMPTLRLSPVQYAALLDAIKASATGPAIPTPGLTGTDGFVAATGRFSALNTCNVWIGEMLRRAGIDAGAWTPTPISLRVALRRLGRAGDGLDLRRVLAPQTFGEEI